MCSIKALCSLIPYCVQVVSRQGNPYYEIQAEEKPEFVAPVDAAKAILINMKGTRLTEFFKSTLTRH